ncbi:TPA: hypothetical protein RU621_004765 [Salmonella enterica]|uniref:hypothetical protein n=1 Tax=Salmonella enterica TaxID=28901 RepID=UPI000DF02DFA|nr:hypothetical protein DOE63_04030 [Salmonella enterica subsp. diarizonae serovar 59:z10:-]HEA0253481.1 hypothetical protein [Salmonella enterica]AXC68562.1 hypothetical protein DOE63_25815 [Salmonella enterica subsp. diarizonae serovar 59:z10:-]HEA0273644.1 hypothetical protein [Salmonella enterica]HEA0334080.1 hypothetical protein [Salmonella enterica]
MKGIDFSRMTPEKMGDLIAAATRQLEAMNESGCSKDAMKKSLFPVIQKIREKKHKLDHAVNEVIDKTADLELCIERMEEVLNGILDQGAGNAGKADGNGQ